jgi:acyl-homoserine-lactone acylase
MDRVDGISGADLLQETSMKTLLTSLLALGVSATAFAQADGNAEIRWDEWGVPHIRSQSLHDAAYATGWAEMSARGQAVAVGFLMARGEGAACMGPDMLDYDRRMHMLDVPARAERWLEVQPAEAREVLTGFAAGMNAWLEANPPQGGPLMCLGAVRESDSLAYLQLMLHVNVVAFGADNLIDEWRDPRGSNAYAVAPERTDDGRTLLFINPHSPWQGPFASFEMHMTASDIDFYGMSYPGLPLPIMGFGQDHGWAYTFNDIDGFDLYNLELVEGGYRFGDEVLELQTRTVEIGVRQGDGSVMVEALTVQESVHGPVLAQADGRALAVRLAGLDRPHLMTQLLAMLRADGLDEFKDALAQQHLPITNSVYGNADGEIYYVFNGLSPVRPHGDRGYWAGVVDGSDPELLWTEYLPFNALPQLENPASGFVQNANDGPTSSTWPMQIDMTSLDATLSNDILTPRGRRSLRQLEQAGTMSFDRMDELRRSSHMDIAERAAPQLAALASTSRRNDLRAMGQVLADWDGSTRPDSRGGVLFSEWAYQMRRAGNDMFGEAIDPMSVDASTLADDAAALLALQVAGERILDRYGRYDPAWGDVYRIRHAGLDLPSGIGRDELGAYRAGHYDYNRDDNIFSLNSAAHFIAMVAFGEDGPEARGLLAYGNSERPDAPGVHAQLELFSNGDVREMYFDRASVEGHTVTQEDFVIAR